MTVPPVLFLISALLVGFGAESWMVLGAFDLLPVLLFLDWAGLGLGCP